jgi:hypothetical protein
MSQQQRTATPDPAPSDPMPDGMWRAVLTDLQAASKPGFLSNNAASLNCRAMSKSSQLKHRV